MKTFKLLTAGLAIITLLFTSCKKEEETQDETANLTLAKTSLTLKVGEYEKVAIKTGNGTYTATSSDITKATVSLVNNELTITALAEGLATVTVSDAKNRTADISVKVLDLVVPGEHITLLKGNTATRTISFGNDYKVATTDAAIATATIANNLLTIEAISKGNALVTVKDLVSEKVQTFSVTVESQPLALSVATVALTKGEKVAVAIVSGNSSYTVSVADTAVAAATVSGTTVTVTGVGVGTTKITVKDADDKTAELSVTVNAFSLTLERNAVEVNADAAVEVAIRSGNGNYTVQVADNSKATATIVGDKVRIEGKEAGTTKVTVKDSQNKTAEITVTVKPRGLSLERTALTINAGTTAEVAIFSGNGGYTVQVADNSKATATIVGNKVRIEGKAAGTTKVTVKDGQNKTAEITVTVNAFSLTLERNAVEVNADAAVEVAITAGNGNYTVQVADNSKATATIVGDKVRIEGKAAGTTKVTVKDSQNKTAEITVTVKPRGLSLERTALTINAGTTAEVAIFSGNGGYTVQVADNSKVTASVVNNKVRIEGKAAGTTKVTVKDGQNKTAEITVTVNAFSLTLERNAVELNPDDTAEVSITNGNGNYTLQVADNSKATATIVGNKVRIEGKAAGTTKVTVKDGQNKTAEITVTVNAFSLTLERTTLTINAGTTAEVAITAGNGNYTLQVADNSKATATIAGDKVRIEGKAAGTTKVIVKDSQNKTAEITVTVNAFSLTLERTALTINAGTTAEVAIFSGNGGYTVQVADNSKATATIVGNKVRIEAKAAGTTKVIVKDSQNKTAEITVTINPFNLSLERNALTINAGTTAEVAIFSGNGGYTVQVADNSKATATIVGNKVRIEGKAAGTTKVTVKDSQNKTAEITVTVNAFSLTLERTTLTINAGTTAEVAITAGNGNYTLQVADNSKVTASVVNNKVRIEAKAAGTTKVTVKDSQNKTAEITVTINPFNLSLERNALTINAGTTAEVAIFSGNGGYTVQVADNSKATATIVGNKVRIEGKAAGTTKVTVKDSQNKTAEITVTVNAFSLTLERNAVEVNADAAVDVAITAGNGNYTVQVADNSKATATIVGDKVRIEGKAAGTTKVTVKDSQNKTAEITVTVKPRGLSLERTALTINAGTTAEVAITAGNGNYTVQVADNSKATATIVG
ncbi:beta strand repeat-containing protein, partial [Capnocytophaga bilenii]